MKKRTKKLLSVTGGGFGRFERLRLDAISKSFLVLFFKKELLPGSLDRAQNRPDFIGSTCRLEDTQRAGGWCFHLIGRFFRLEQKKRLPLADRLPVTREPFGQIALVHGKANLWKQNFGCHDDENPPQARRIHAGRRTGDA